MPTSVPKAAPIATTEIPASSEIRAPKIRREKQSRPSASVPSQCAAEGGRSRLVTSTKSGG